MILLHIEDGTARPASTSAEDWLRKHDGRKVWVREVDAGKRRSIQQNSLLWAWLGLLAAQSQDSTVDEIHRWCKLTIGVPILRRDSERFREVYDRCLKGLAYTDKLNAMALVDITSVMDTRQFTELLETLEQRAAERGIVLPRPDDAQEFLKTT
jgi:hypothetical protein